jgi:hypothetical protein
MLAHLSRALILALLVAANPSDPQAAPTEQAAGWPHSTPEAQGMSSEELATLLQRIGGENPGRLRVHCPM